MKDPVQRLRAHLDDQVSPTSVLLAKAVDEIEMLTKAGVIECAVRNPAVAEYMKHWEGRATTAEAQNEALTKFAAEILESWPLGDVDGGELQDIAVKHGLLLPEERFAPCAEEGCSCAEYYAPDEWAEGVTCYRRAPHIQAARKP